MLCVTGIRHNRSHCRTKSKLLTSYQLTRKETDLIKSVKNDPDVIVKPSHNGKGFVVLPNTEYVAKAERILENENEYEKLVKIVDKLDQDMRDFLKELADVLDKRLLTATKPHNSRMAKFYGLPKDHKPSLPLCTVVSSCDSSTSGIPLVLERILNQLLPFVEARLDSTQTCIVHLEKHKNVPAGCIVASIDVGGLYSNILIEASAEAAVAKLE